MRLEIYSKDGTLRTAISPADSSSQSKEIGGDNVLSLSFTLYEYIPLDVNDYVDFMGERYWLTEKYEPTEKSTVEWQYDVKFYGIENLISRYLVINPEPTVDNPAVFTLTDKPEAHLALIVQCINNALGADDWKVGAIADEYADTNIVVDYDGTYCDEALQAVAEACGDNVEWWVDGQTINIGRCEWGEPYELAYGEGKGLTTLERTTADNVKFYTRLYVIGSTRNISAESYGYMRLMLPGKAAYIDIEDRIKAYGIIDNAESDAFADIYPSYTFTVKSVRRETAQDDDGNDFYIYYVTPEEIPFDPDDCLMDGEVIHLSFQSGELNGLGSEDDNGYYFEANWHADTGEFEIITIWPYDDDTQLPNDTLIPKEGDEFILWNMNMPDEYVTDAENRLLEEAEKFNAANAVDPAVYKVSTDWIWARANLTDEQLSIGHKVTLVSDEYFDNGSRDSRITKITRKVTLPWQCDIEIGDVVSIGKLTSLQDTVSAQIAKAVSVSNISVIKTGDATKFTDYNVLSSLRAKAEFISKKENDTAQGLITFKGGIKVGAYETGESGAQITALGNAEFESVVARTAVRSPLFVNGFTGEGFSIHEDSGNWYAEFDYLTVRRAMNVYELLINKVRSVAGMMVISCANGKIASVETSKNSQSAPTIYTITLEEEGGFAAGDWIYCQHWTGDNVKYYFAHLQAVRDDGLTLLTLSGVMTGNGVPEEGDEVVQWGSTTDENRRGLIYLSATEDGQPRIDILNGVQSSSTSGCLRARLGCLDGIEDSYFPEDLQPSGYGLYADNAFLHGTFVLTNGNDILTQFEITEGKVSSLVTGEITADGNLLNNGAFDDGEEHWTLSGSAEIVEDGYHNAARFPAGTGYIEQLNADFKSLPATDAGAFIPVTLTFRYKVDGSGGGGLYLAFYSDTYKYGYKGFSKEDDSSTSSPTLVVLSDTAGEYVEQTVSGYWDGQGSLRIQWSGSVPVYLYALKLQSSVTADDIVQKYATLFNQSAALIELAAYVFDNDDNPLGLSGLMIRPSGAGIYSQTKDGAFALIGTEVTDGDTTVIKLTADNIQLEGYTSINKYFIVNTDGSITTTNATVTGTINANAGYIGGFTISSGDLKGSDASIYFYQSNGGKSMILTPSGITFGNGSTSANAGVALGAGDQMSVASISTISYFNNDMSSQAYEAAIYARCTNTSTYASTAGYRDADAMRGAHAFFSPKGDICGFRLRTRRISSSATLTVYDSIILVSASGVTLTLPSGPEDGQLYLIMRTVSSSYTVSTGSSSVYIYSDYGTISHCVTSHSVSDDQPRLYLYDAGNACWRLSWLNMN